MLDRARSPRRNWRIAAGALTALSLAAPAHAEDTAWLTGQTSPLGPAIGPDRAVARAEVDWSGAYGTATAGARAEVRLWRGLSVFAGASGAFAGTDAPTRPRAGAAYQLTDPRRDPVGVRLQLEYKPEGLVEPEGEVEATIALSRRLGRGAVAMTAVYGQDPEAVERDAELALEARAPITARATLGFAARARRSLGTPRNDEPRADAFAAPFAAIAVGRYQLAAACGVAAIDRAAGGADVGMLTSVVLAVDW
ncbi:MAG: hypothetical protein K8W52_05895 [Deltaproteobacteria bacterium]|nr:hypothetical protein [Deltaproteobacteria bacterium]